MNCSEVSALLALQDPARAPDVRQLGDHLTDCARCRNQYPELAWLLEVRPADRPVRVPVFAPPLRSAWISARWLAAAVLLTAGWFGWDMFSGADRHPEPHHPDTRPPIPAATTDRGFVAGDLGTVSYRSITIHRGHRNEAVTMTGVLPHAVAASPPEDRRLR
ncbi:MAG: hypothetical protein JXA87_04230 [Thermoleophilia bacterium]|nr:hypothetical protein [Thermoleophilia bacterium]